jgi:hypothetical protein
MQSYITAGGSEHPRTAVLNIENHNVIKGRLEGRSRP